MYMKKCKELEIKPNPQALPKPEDDRPSDITKQASLDGFIQGIASVKWSKEGLLKHILNFVVSDDQVSRFLSIFIYCFDFVYSPFVSLIRSLSKSSSSTNIQQQRNLTSLTIQNLMLLLKLMPTESRNIFIFNRFHTIEPFFNCELT